MHRTDKRRGDDIIEDAFNKFAVVVVWPCVRISLHEWELPESFAILSDVITDREIGRGRRRKFVSAPEAGNSLNFATGAGTHRDVVTLLHGVLL